MRLIDADELKKVNEEEVIKYSDYFTGEMITGMKLVCEYATKDAPIVDAVPVVRCKDCKYFDWWGPKGKETFDCIRFLEAPAITPEWYCAWGETKDE